MELQKIHRDFSVCKVTDYILVKKENEAKALKCLTREGYLFKE